MSSYLNFYLVPRKKKGQRKKQKPLLFHSINRANPIYGKFYETLNPTFIGNDEEYHYSELSYDDVKNVISSLKEDISETEKRFKRRIEAIKELKNIKDNELDDYVTDYLDTKDYLDELNEALTEIEYIGIWVDDIEYSDFEKVLINVD